jgi:hypothetical protein
MHEHIKLTIETAAAWRDDNYEICICLHNVIFKQEYGCTGVAKVINLMGHK